MAALNWLRLGRRRRLAVSTRIAPYTPVRLISAYAKWPLIAILFAFALLYGAAFSFLAPYLVTPLLIPLLILAAFVLWALPEVRNPPTKLMTILFFAFFVAMIMWPGYLAIALPGIPRVSPLRITAVPLTLVFGACLSTSKAFRSQLKEILAASPLVFQSVLFFTALQFISIAYSINTTSSVILFFTQIVNGTSLIFIAAWVFSRKGQAEKFAGILCGMGLAMSLLAGAEVRAGHVLWAGHIPSFLQIDDPVVQQILAGTSRSGYRAQGTFVTSLSMSEFLALTMPFLLHFAYEKYRSIIRIGAGVTIPLVLLGTLATQARTGLLGIVLAFFLYPLVIGILRWRQNKRSFLLSIILYLSPLLIAIAAAVGYSVPGIRIRLLGGGAAQLSNQGRTEQWNMGIPKILSHPWGYGIGQGAAALGFTNREGFLTIDSYPLRLTLEYGVIGIVIYYLQHLAALYYAAKAAFVANEDDREGRVAIPLGIALLSFAAMQINFAQADAEPIMSAMLGMAIAFGYRYGSKASLLQLWKGTASEEVRAKGMYQARSL